jgi:hypothetical protein
LKKPVDDLLNESSVDVINDRDLEELREFQEYLSDYKIVAFVALRHDRVIFSGNSLSAKQLYLLYDRESRHYNVITNLKADMAKRYIYNGCNTLYDYTNKCDKSCSLYSATPVRRIRPCIVVHAKPLSQSEMLSASLTHKMKGKLVRQWKKICQERNYLVTGDCKLECGKRYCNYYNKRQPLSHSCYVAPLTPSKLSDKYMYIFFDTKCTQDLDKSDGVFSIFRTSHLLSKCVRSVLPWTL